MSSKFYIPPVFVEAESGFIPPLSTFKKRPAELDVSKVRN